MVVGGFRDLFVAIATCAATLIGLLFVAMSIAQGRSQAHPQEIREFRAAAALLAFTNAFSVALFGLVPGTNVGIPSGIVGLIGVLFTAAGVRTIVALDMEKEERRRQLVLVIALLLVFGYELVYGIQLMIDSHHGGALTAVALGLIASLLIGIGRAWELVGAWDTGLFASVGRLIGRETRIGGPIDQETPGSSEVNQEG
jgi:hypothetical protein